MIEDLENQKDFENKTPLDEAIKAKATETANLLRKRGGKTGEELKAECKRPLEGKTNPPLPLPGGPPRAQRSLRPGNLSP